MCNRISQFLFDAKKRQTPSGHPIKWSGSKRKVPERI